MQKIAHYISSFFSKINFINNSVHYPFVILLSIIAYESMKINLQIIFKEVHGNVSLFDNAWVLSSVVGSTLLGFLSDRFIRFSWRKPICLIGIFFSIIIGIAFLHPALHNSANKFSILFFIILNGLSGSYLGAARAFYLDQFHQNKVFYFAITVIFQCVPWIFIGGLLTEQIITSNFLHYFSIVILAITFFATIFFIKDKRKSQFESRHGEDELKELFHKYNHVKDWSIILSFFILSTSYHLMPYIGEYVFPNTAFYQEIFLLGLGVGLGVPIAFIFIKAPTIQSLKIGYIVCFLFFLALGFLYYTGIIVDEKTLKYQFLAFAVIGGTLWILSLKEFLIKSKLTEDGLVLGFIESVQSLGEFVGAGLPALMPSFVILKKELNVKLFLCLFLVAFIILSLENILKFIKRKNSPKI